MTQPSPSERALSERTLSERAIAIIFDPLFDDIPPPERATSGSAGYDVRAYTRGRTIRCCADPAAGPDERRADAESGAFTLAPGERALIPLGFRARLPAGYEAQIRLRSSVAFRKGLILPNAPATIDSDYPDEWLVMVRNDNAVPVTIEHGERIAQVILNRYELLPWARGAVAGTTDRTGGLGSTGRF